jgi:CRISPR-associated protein Csm3
MTYQLMGKYVLEGEIKCMTGLHIGGATTGIEIGGVDNPVIKDPLTDEPYIPGSSLKGKLRSLTEWSFGLVAPHKKHANSFVAYDCRELENPCPDDPIEKQRWMRALVVGRLYGASSDENKVRMQAGPSRLTVRDSFLTEDSKKKLELMLGKGFYTEVKTENTLDRVTSEANPRPIERVLKGSAFDFSMIIDIYQTPEIVLYPDHDLLIDLFAIMRLLEQSTLGGSGSRGSGQIMFEKLRLTWRSLEHYRQGKLEQIVALPGETLDAILNNKINISWPA